MDNKIKKPATVDGVRAIEMRYRAIWSAADKIPTFYQSSAVLNSPDMGVLLPERFMPVLESDDRCVPIFKLALLQTLRTADKFEEREIGFEWISVFIPLRLLRKSDGVRKVREFVGQMGALPQKICFEIDSAVLDDTELYAEPMKQLRRAGYHTMLSELDGSNIPVFRLGELEPEYILLKNDPERRIGTDKRTDECLRSMMSFISDIGSEPIFTGVFTSEEADGVYDLGCSYFIGDEESHEFSGRATFDRFIKKST